MMLRAEDIYFQVTGNSIHAYLLYFHTPSRREWSHEIYSLWAQNRVYSSTTMTRHWRGSW